LLCSVLLQLWFMPLRFESRNAMFLNIDLTSSSYGTIPISTFTKRLAFAESFDQSSSYSRRVFLFSAKEGPSGFRSGCGELHRRCRMQHFTVPVTSTHFTCHAMRPRHTGSREQPKPPHRGRTEVNFGSMTMSTEAKCGDRRR